jgi:hypothetical protein
MTNSVLPVSGLTKKTTIKVKVVYGLAVCLLFCLVGVIRLAQLDSVQLEYMGMQMGFLGLGLLHAQLIYRLLPALDEPSGKKGAMATCLYAFTGSAALVIFYRVSGLIEYSYSWLYALSSAGFTLPFFIRLSMRYLVRIPAKLYKKWYYPLGNTMPDVDRLDLSKVLVIQFEFPKKYKEQQHTNFKAKAPVEMSMGNLFFIFINDYNERTPDSKIGYLNEQGQPYGWVFYRKTFWWQTRKYFDPDLSFKDNGILDNFVIIADRMP